MEEWQGKENSKNLVVGPKKFKVSDIFVLISFINK